MAKWATRIGVIIGLLCGCQHSPVATGPGVPVELPHTINGAFDKDDRRWYFTGFVLNTTDTTVQVVPVIGLTDDEYTIRWVRQYVGVLADSIVPGSYPGYALYEAHAVRQSIAPGEQVRHLTITDRIDTIAERPLYWYFWLASPYGTVTKPHAIATREVP